MTSVKAYCKKPEMAICPCLISTMFKPMNGMYIPGVNIVIFSSRPVHSRRIALPRQLLRFYYYCITYLPRQCSDATTLAGRRNDGKGNFTNVTAQKLESNSINLTTTWKSNSG